MFHTSFHTGDQNEAGNPSFTTQAGEAGPRFQQDSCIGCHMSNGKSTPGFATPLSSMVVLTGDDSQGVVVPDNRFGTNLEQGLVTADGQTFDGRQALLQIDAYTTVSGRYTDGTPYILQKPPRITS